jgi:hypothetical protein
LSSSSSSKTLAATFGGGRKSFNTQKKMVTNESHVIRASNFGPHENFQLVLSKSVSPFRDELHTPRSPIIGQCP